jgi:hypothetical protein
LRVAQQTIYHDAERPSHIVLPVIPSRDRPTDVRIDRSRLH